MHQGKMEFVCNCRSVNLERVQQRLGQDVSEELCRGDPQLPQGFTPLRQHLHIRPGDTLKATCMFDSSQMKQQVNAGATHNDEMCNLYLMLYSQLPFFMACYGSSQVDRHGMGGIPAEGRLEVSIMRKAHHHHHHHQTAYQCWRHPHS